MIKTNKTMKEVAKEVLKEENKDKLLSNYIGVLTTVLVVMLAAQWSQNSSFQTKMEERYYEHDKTLTRHEIILNEIKGELSQRVPEKNKEKQDLDIALINKPLKVELLKSKK